MELKICHIYPDILNLYGDRGNILCMERRLQWRGISVTTEGVPVGEKLDADKFDLFFIGGGQEFDMDILLQDLKQNKSQAISSAIEDGKTFLTICGGYQLLGRSYKTMAGNEFEFIGALDFHTVEDKKRLTGNYMFSCEDTPGISVVGFENHNGKTYLGSGVRPLGRVITGFGNNGEDGTEGVRYQNVFGTYSHGCVLPKNPALCDVILKTALTRKYGSVELEPLSDVLENAAHDYMQNRLIK